MTFVSNDLARWSSPRDLTVHARMRLFCLPHAGAGAAGFYRWRRALPDGVDLVPILLPGREVRLSEPPFTDAAALVTALLSAIKLHLDRPYAIFGHSMGALLAFELARAVRGAGLREPRHLWVSGRIAPQLPPLHPGLSTLPEPQMLHELGFRYGGLPQVLLDDAELRDHFLPTLRADLAVVDSYRYRPQPPLDCPFTVFAGDADRSVTAAGLEAWQFQTTGAFAVKMFAGDHFYQMGASGTALVSELAEGLGQSSN